MFRDARALDRHRTAASFEQALRRYAADAESWFDGSVGSVDARLAQCNKLAHVAAFTVARLDISATRGYLGAADSLDADRRALEAMREDLLTGGAGRQDVLGPPGWHTASPDEWSLQNKSDRGMGDLFQNTQTPRFDPEEEYQHRTDQAREYAERTDPNTTGRAPRPVGPNPAAGREVAQQRQQLQDERGQAVQRQRSRTEAPAHLGPTPHRGDPDVQSDLHWQGDQPYATGTDPTAVKGQMSLFKETPHEDLPPLNKYLGRADARWVNLESAKFVAANTGCLDDSHELATRAHHWAQIKTSTFTSARSAAICKAFVASVSAQGRSAYQPPPPRPRTASVEDIDAEAIYLC